jgi:hypothetical protein
VAQRAADHLVGVAPAHPVPVQVPGLLEVVEHQLHHALGDADLLGHLANASVRLPAQAQQHVGVVGEEGPAAVRHAGTLEPGDDR